MFPILNYKTMENGKVSSWLDKVRFTEHGNLASLYALSNNVHPNELSLDDVRKFECAMHYNVIVPLTMTCDNYLPLCNQKHGQLVYTQNC